MNRGACGFPVRKNIAYCSSVTLSIAGELHLKLDAEMKGTGFSL